MAFCSIKVEKILLAKLTLDRQSVVFSWNSINGIIEWNRRQIVESMFFCQCRPRFLKLTQLRGSCDG
jgi:hypothetical protein